MALFDTSPQDLNEDKMKMRQPTDGTEEERLAAEMARIDTELSSVYAQIGEQYYEEADLDSLSETMRPLFDEVTEKKKNIQEINDRIRSLKGITTCKECGADVMVTDTFCSTCGARIITEVTVSPDGGICSSCGARLEAGQTFCSTCGAKVTILEDAFFDEEDLEKTEIYFPRTSQLGGKEQTEEESSEQAEEESFGQSEQESLFAEEKRVCPYCGEEVQKGMLFCMFCGKPIEARPETKEKQDAQKPAEETESVFCPNCGAVLEPGDVFCINCGQKVLN